MRQVDRLHDSRLFSHIVVLLVCDEHANQGVSKWVLNDLSHILQVGVLANLLDDVLLCDMYLRPFPQLLIPIDAFGCVDEAHMAVSV